MTDGNKRRRQVNLQIASFVIESHDHPDVFVPGHALRLAIGEAQTERPHIATKEAERKQWL
ncbi:MAG TPA: hypothetical protein VI260_13500 [Blastocatellia bacterium]|jgi:hypothetical protein